LSHRPVAIAAPCQTWEFILIVKTNCRLAAALGCAGLLAGLLQSGTARADESFWLYARGSETLPKGEIEAVFETVNRRDKDSGSYSFWDFRPEIEYGVTDKLTVKAEAVFFRHDYSNVEWAPINENASFHKTQFAGYELALKYNFLSPYKDALGLAVGMAYERRTHYRLDGAPIAQDSFVPSLYLQKNFLDNLLVIAWSTKLEFERRKSPGVLEEEIAVDSALGVSYRIAPHWYAGAEIRYQSDFLNPQIYDEAGNPGFDSQGFEAGYSRSSFDLFDWRLGSQYQYGTYFGPSLHYGAQKWWATTSLLYQVKGGGDSSRNPSIIDGHNWDEHERYHFGLVVGFPF
jgi:hypothetical protein